MYRQVHIFPVSSTTGQKDQYTSGPQSTIFIFLRGNVVFLCLVILSFAAICDVYSGRIPRELTGFGMLISQAWLVYHASVREGLTALICSVGLLMILYPLFMIGTLGAGDIKLIMILPAFMTFTDALYSVFLSFVAGACIGLVRMIATGTLIGRLRVMKSYIEAVSKAGKLLMYDYPASVTGDGFKQHQIHFTIPILIGTVMSSGGYFRL